MARTILGSILNRMFRNELNRMLEELYEAKSSSERVLSDKGISTNLLADGAVDYRVLANGAVRPEHFVSNAVREIALAGNSVGTTKIQDNSVTNPKIAPEAITNSKISDGAITGLKLNAGVVSNRNLADNAVQPDNIVNNAILERHLAGKIITPSKISDNLSEKISKTDIKIFGAIYYEELSRSKIRIERPVQSLGYLTNGGTFKWIRDIEDGIELNQNESLIFNVSTGETYIDTSQINSGQIATGRFGLDDEIILISYLGYGRVTSPAEIIELNADLDGISLLKGSNYITVHVQQEGKDFVGYNFLKSTKTYSPGDKTSNVDIWSFRKFAEYERTGKHTFTHQRDLYENATQDLMIRENGVTDYMGGAAHGDEIKQSVKMYLDDKELDESDTYTNMYGKEFKLLIQTHLYRDTNFTNGDMQHLATAYKTYTVNKDGYILDVEVEWHEEVNLRECQIGALSLYKTDGNGNYVFNFAVFNGLKGEYDLSITEAELDRVENVNGVYFTGSDLTLNWSTEKRDWIEGSTTLINRTNEHMNKLYSNYVPNGYVTSVDEVFKQTTKYELNRILN